MLQKPLEKPGRSSDKLTRSIFFLCAVLFHLIVFIAVANYILFPPIVAPQEVTMITPPPPNVPQVEPPPIPVPPKLPAQTLEVISKGDSSGSVESTKLLINPPPVDVFKETDSRDIANHLPKTDPKIEPQLSDPRLAKFKHDLDLWGMTVADLNSDTPKAKFPVYVASYANGDWACNSRLDKEGNIVAGSIPNLMAKIAEWSHGNIKGELVPKPLNIASSELLEKMPVFIFFTGHKDFVLTQPEIENLREYLNDGGMIWGDNALAGTGSRFDVAFRREMKRVVTDSDKNFVPYSPDDKIFARGRFPLSEFPAGMNYYAEPPQHLDIDGILAILYTPNDYSDMMFMRINPGDASFFQTYKPVPPGVLYTNNAFVEKQTVFYRNFDLKSSLAVHHMGMDIVNYLLIRFRDKLMLPP